MRTVDDLALARSAGHLPQIPGDSRLEQLVNGRQMAEVAIRQYVGTLSFSEVDSEGANTEIRAWELRNEDALSDMFADTSMEVLPEELRLELGATLMQQWVIARFNRAAWGLPAWESGEIHRRAAEDPSVNETWAVEDADMRLLIFRTILEMDETGELERIFRPTATLSTSGENLAVGVGLYLVIMLGVVLVAAVIAGGIILDRHLQDNNRMIADWCRQAEEDGDDEVLLQCVRGTQDLNDPFTPFAREGGRVLLWLGGGYLAIRYAIPWLLDRIGEAGFGRRS